jgi:hypothetical protein
VDGIAKLATEQGAAFLIGLAVIAVIQPGTPGGAVLLLLCGIAVTNVIIQVTRLVLKKRVGGNEENNNTAKPSTTPKRPAKKAK